MKDSTRRVLTFALLRGEDGVTEAEILAATGIRSGAQRIHEIKAMREYRVTKVMERSPMGALYARWFVVPVRAFAPLTGVQEGLALA